MELLKQTSPHASGVRANRMTRLHVYAGVFCAALLHGACHASSASPASQTSVAAASTTPAAPVSASARPVHWGYAGDEGPSHWAELSPVYAACIARAQSPIDITGSAKANGGWRTNYRETGLKIAHHEHVTDIIDNGHTIQVTVDEGSTLTTDRGSYALKQFHFHTPSEHTVDGESFPMEVHFVHQAADGNFAVLSVLVQEGASNDNLAKLIANFPAQKGDAQFLPEVRLDLSLHIPAKSAAHNYLGSFTTPPCTENVEWLVLRSPVSASREQLDAFAARLNHNNRPIQALNGRSISEGELGRSFEKLGAPVGSAVRKP
jgi:carbonic anhydrase